MSAADESRLLALLSSLRREPARSLPVSLTDAASRGDLEAVKRFLADGSSVDEESVGYASPLAAAAGAGHGAVVDFLLERGAKAEPPKAYVPPIANAVTHGHVAIVEKLLAAGASLENARRGLGAATNFGHAEVVRYLLERGLDIDVPIGPGQTLTVRAQILDFAEAVRQERVKQVLRGEEPAPPKAVAPRETKPITDAERRAWIDEACALVRKLGARAASLERRREPLLCYAAEQGLVEIARALLDVGGRPDARNAETRFTPLMLAAASGHRDMVALLLERGADPNSKSAIGLTALIRACEFGDIAAVKLLLAAGADPSVRTQGDETAAKAAGGPDAKDIKALLPKKARRPKPAVVFAKTTKKLAISGVAGAKEFVKRARRGPGEWSLVAVRADGATVAKVLEETGRVETNALIRSVAQLDRESAAFILQLAGHAWTLVVRSIGWVDAKLLDAVRADAKTLSLRLATDAIVFVAEETAGIESWSSFAKGELAAEDDTSGDADPDAFFAERGVFLPPLAIVSDGLSVRIELRGLGREDVAYAAVVLEGA
ncbi:MAG: ankyrin repeat domain-containing protein [Planctomycetota bacterium]